MKVNSCAKYNPGFEVSRLRTPNPLPTWKPGFQNPAPPPPSPATRLVCALLQQRLDAVQVALLRCKVERALALRSRVHPGAPNFYRPYLGHLKEREAQIGWFLAHQKGTSTKEAQEQPPKGGPLRTVRASQACPLRGTCRKCPPDPVVSENAAADCRAAKAPKPYNPLHSRNPNGSVDP